MHGRARADSPMPACLEMLGLKHALMVVYQYLLQPGVVSPKRIVVEIADRHLVDVILRWFNEGIFSAKTEGASEVVRLLRALDILLPCQLCVRDLPSDFFEDCVEGGLEAGGALLDAAYRLFWKVLPIGRNMFGGKMAWLPLTKKEVKKGALNRYEEDEAKAVQMLGSLGSEACRIHKVLGLDREIICAVLKDLTGNRSAQVTLCSIIFATRFKFYDKKVSGVLYPTVCRSYERGCIETFEHLRDCLGLRYIPKHAEFPRDYLMELAVRANISNPGLPARYVEPEEICRVQYSDSSLEEISLQL